MSMVLLDTNIISYLFKGDTRGAAYTSHLLNQEL
jgi:predicted nucleic acid-binding protein